MRAGREGRRVSSFQRCLCPVLPSTLVSWTLQAGHTPRAGLSPLSWVPSLLGVSYPYSQLSPAQGLPQVASPWVWLSCSDPALSSWSPLICFCAISVLLGRSEGGHPS